MYLTITNRFFELFIYCVIVISAITLALNGPRVDPSGELMYILWWIDVISTSIFTFEALLKMIALGLILNGEGSYLRKGENVLDFLVILGSMAALTPLPDSMQTIKVLRIMRLINKNEGLRLGVRALIRAIPNVLNVTVIMLLFFLIFGVILVSQFKGTFYNCTSDAQTQVLTINTKWDCLNAGGIWYNQVYNFDNIPNAVVTLFMMATASGWSSVLALA